MDAIKEWSLGLCYVSCACMIAYYILPSGKLTESTKRIISVLCLSALTIPLITGGMSLPEIDFDPPGNDATDISGQISGQLCTAAESRIKSALEASVNSLYSGEYEIFVTADIQPDNSILINEIRVVLHSGEGDVRAVRSQIEVDAGITPVIVDEREG